MLLFSSVPYLLLHQKTMAIINPRTAKAPITVPTRKLVPGNTWGNDIVSSSRGGAVLMLPFTVGDCAPADDVVLEGSVTAETAVELACTTKDWVLTIPEDFVVE